MEKNYKLNVINSGNVPEQFKDFKFDNKWYGNQIKCQRRLYEKDLKKMSDPGYVWPTLKMQIFLEGVMTLKAVPHVLEIETPDGMFKLSTLRLSDGTLWHIEHAGRFSYIDVNALLMSIVEKYPDGTFGDYLNLGVEIMGCGDEKFTNEIWDKSFWKAA